MKAHPTLRQALLFVPATVFLATVPAFACGSGTGSVCSCEVDAAKLELKDIQAQATNASISLNFRSLGDQEFIREVLEDGTTKVMLGQLAQKKSQSDDVKQFGQTMAQDNSQFNEQVLAQVAKLIGLEGPRGLSKKDKQLAASFEALSGPQFDEEYSKLMVKEHQRDLKEFTSEAHNTEDRIMKMAAGHGMNIVSQHLELIEEIAQKHSAAAPDHNTVALNLAPAIASK
jgi:putative membrane protein